MQVQASNVYVSMPSIQPIEEPTVGVVADAQTNAALLDPTKLKDKKLDGVNAGACDLAPIAVDADACKEASAADAEACANETCTADLNEVALKV